MQEYRVRLSSWHFPAPLLLCVKHRIHLPYTSPAHRIASTISSKVCVVLGTTSMLLFTEPANVVPPNAGSVISDQASPRTAWW
jgi:hypothetical protein